MKQAVKRLFPGPIWQRARRFKAKRNGLELHADARLPHSVQADRSAPLRKHWRARLAQQFSDSYAGLPLWKFPEDLRIYEHLLWLDRIDVVIEIGTAHGGSAMWFRDRLRSNAAYGRIRQPLVVSIDRDLELARSGIQAIDPDYASSIVLLAGDVLDESLPRRVAEHIPTGARALVIEDSAHTYETTLAALRGFSPFVHPAGYFVVEDGSVDVDELRISRKWPRGVHAAIDDWLRTKEGSGFRRRPDLELYGVTSHPGGFLQREPAP